MTKGEVEKTKGEAKKRGPRRGRGSVTRNRVGNRQVRYTDPDGKRRAGGTFRVGRKGDADQKLADILTSISNGTWRSPDHQVSTSSRRMDRSGLSANPVSTLSTSRAYSAVV